MLSPSAPLATEAALDAPPAPEAPLAPLAPLAPQSPEAPEAIELRPVVAGKYELLRPLGHGSMGEVWLARHRTLGEDVAVKLLKRPPWSGDYFEDHSTSAARFRLEAQVAARLSRKTKHIVRVTDHGEERDLAYLVMEFLEGKTLEERLSDGPPITVEEIAEIVTQLGRALECAHAEGVVHRDLKPANVFLTVDEEGQPLVKIFDFGIACLTPVRRACACACAPETSERRPPSHTDDAPTGPRVLLGTPGYMSPEQARGQSPLDLQCDLWALATIGYEALTRQLPVEGTEPDELLKNLGAGRTVPFRERAGGEAGPVDEFFARALAESVHDRFSDAGEMVRAFRAAAAVGTPELRVAGALEARCEAPVAAVGSAPPVSSGARRPRVTSPSRIIRSPRRRAAVACLAVLSAVAAACGLAEHPPYGMHAPAKTAPFVAALGVDTPAPMPMSHPPAPATPPWPAEPEASPGVLSAGVPARAVSSAVADEHAPIQRPILQNVNAAPSSAMRRSHDARNARDKSAVL